MRRILSGRLAASSAVAAGLLCSCAANLGPESPPTEAEIQACEAQGGAFEYIYALDTYACRLPPEDSETREH